MSLSTKVHLYFYMYIINEQEHYKHHSFFFQKKNKNFQTIISSLTFSTYPFILTSKQIILI